jgi:hypothetical protein
VSGFEPDDPTFPVAPQRGAGAGHPGDSWTRRAIRDYHRHYGGSAANYTPFIAAYKSRYTMPRSYTRKRTYSRRGSYGRGTRGVSQRSRISSRARFAMRSVPRGLPVGPAPPKMVRKLHLQYNRVLNNTAGNYVQMEINGNSLINPIKEAEAAEGQSAIGPASEQVYGKDQLAAFYEDYYITGATAVFTMMPTSTVTDLSDAAKPKEYPIQAYLLAIEDNDTSHPNPTTPETLKEHGAQQRMVPLNKVFRMKMSKSTSYVLGGAAYSAIRASTDDTAHPTRTWKFLLHLEPFMSVGASEPWEVAVKVDVYYTVHFCNRKELTQSAASAP